MKEFSILLNYKLKLIYLYCHHVYHTTNNWKILQNINFIISYIRGNNNNYKINNNNYVSKYKFYKKEKRKKSY